MFMNKIPPYSLAKKLTIASIVISAGTMIFITGVVYLIVVSFGDTFLNNELNENAELIQKSFTEPMWTFDQQQINEIGKSLLANDKYTYISAIRVESSEGLVLFEKKQASLANKSFQEISKLPYTKWKLINIQKDTQEIGTIAVAMTNYGYVKVFRDQFIIILSASLLILLALAQLVRYYFDRSLTVPMNKILNHVHQIHNENYSVVEIPDLPVELNAISNALNHAGIVIEKRNNDIMYYTNDLERLVKDRTSELEEQMAKNINTARLAAVGEMAAEVAHEINNPLTVIDLHITRLKRSVSENNLNTDSLQSIDKIQGMVKRIVKIIKGLKSLSRDGNHDPFMPFSVAAMIEDVNMLVEMKVKAHNVNFTINVSDHSLIALGREVQISQVLVNLIGNAIDAVMCLEDKWINLDINGKSDEVEFVVTDSGYGIPENLREQIMRPFFTTKELNKGTGLGLSISKSIIEEHNGELVYNHKNQNTQFVFTLKKIIVTKMTA